MSGIDADAVLAGLKPFQQDAAHHVFVRFYGDDAGSDRFLVADETGLGKNVVARGVVARAVDHLQNVDEVKRIDVVYMCSNADRARQNIARPNVTGDHRLPRGVSDRAGHDCPRQTLDGWVPDHQRLTVPVQPCRGQRGPRCAVQQRRPVLVGGAAVLR
ncbi:MULTISPECIES: DEAD/DEAH box helicase [unclassified Curtobacterium]|uniref:DEAD/DEAH box helicase n=1 Tax=unclassified Curtobacterium TaxID=257496 RepID=UPI0011CD3CD6|nr:MULTISPECIES: DEAD/DEAH box helicase [unclassified Curtobacterium]